MNRAVEVRTPSDGFAATFPKGDGFYPDKLKFVAQLMARALSFQSGAVPPALVSPRDRTSSLFTLHFSLKKAPIQPKLYRGEDT